MAVQKIFTATLVGIDATLVEVEADVSNGLPTTIIVGLPDTAVQESRERVRSAIKHTGFSYPQTRVSLNLAPGAVPKIGTHFDLPIALAIILAGGLIPNHLSGLNKQLFVGELSLDGGVRSSAAGVLAMVQTARDAGMDAVFVPQENASMAALVRGISIYPVSTLRELAEHLAGVKFIEPHRISTSIRNEMIRKSISEQIDFISIAGQSQAKRGLEIAAAGGHNILLTGPPGSGKTMLAKALPTIMPSLTEEEILELTKIYNSVGKIHTGAIVRRPFRNPHHTSSSTTLIGGGGIPRPGEVTLAHHGVLFLDELPEFSRAVLEVLRQPLEENMITINRLRHTYTFPASFVLVAAQNPCPCGNFGQTVSERKLECNCHPSIIEKYRKKISGPLLDRIDLFVPVPRLAYKEMENIPLENRDTENSTIIQQRVSIARLRQTKRFGKTQTNNEMSVKQLQKYCALNQECSMLLEQAANKYQLSGRALHRVQKVARTIADLAGCENIRLEHLAESLQYRLREQAWA